MPTRINPDDVAGEIERQIVEMGREDYRADKIECPFHPKSLAAGNWRSGWETEKSMVQVSSTQRPWRPVIRYHGGKFLLADWVLSHFPAHRVYTEPFGGAASVLLAKPRAYSEVYNDANGEVVNLFRVLRDPASALELERQLRLTPFAREEFKTSYTSSSDPIESARRLVVRCYMGFGSAAHNSKTATGFRANSNRSGTTPAHDWANYPDVLPAITARLQGVVIENRPALEILRQHDAPDALHYCDPPYLWGTRSDRQKMNYGRFEMTEAQHLELIETLLSVKGMVIMSGYPSPLYDDLLRGWHREERKSLADGARPRTEVLWLNPQACKQPQPALF